MFDDLISLKEPVISVISPSLNHGRFLKDTVESVLNQSFRQFEHVVVDGGSKDETTTILKEYPHLRWVSEKDNGILDARKKGIAMSRGKYLMQCCVTDGYIDRDWLKRCAHILDTDPEVSLVWGLPQYMSEEGELQNVSYVEFFDNPPPQKRAFLPLWLATGFFFPEGNYCVRREVFERCQPTEDLGDPFREHPDLGFMYNFNASGYLACFVPVIANYSMIHEGHRAAAMRHIEAPIERKYREYVRAYGTQLFSGKITHRFRSGSSEVIGEIAPEELKTYKRDMITYRFTFSPLLAASPLKVFTKLRQNGIAGFLSLAWQKLRH